ncbi:replication initiation protein, RepL2 [Streptomyces heilongjiangensis]|uniref:Replication initiation protein, RepL2 n=1 Tax=Streptomyces heilongjiangensis TaxID=945052 RepID=A0ABW1BHD6_9ACTN|nr:replication initiation protein, RepL2 [Streptomyces heilongjiangensis]MDC2951044.1 replication initiation protein, RepL2 [Streptomyces heilongjiangensis]
MSIECREQIRDLMKLTSDLPPLQRLVVILYAAMDQDDTGTVHETGANLAAEAGMTPQLFSRVRRELVAAGWLEEGPGRIGNVRFYRLTEKADAEGGASVVALRSA